MARKEADGYEFFSDAGSMESSAVINLDHHRRLGMHLVEYGERYDLSTAEMRTLLRMIGL